MRASGAEFAVFMRKRQSLLWTEAGPAPPELLPPPASHPDVHSRTPVSRSVSCAKDERCYHSRSDISSWADASHPGALAQWVGHHVYLESCATFFSAYGTSSSPCTVSNPRNLESSETYLVIRLRCMNCSCVGYRAGKSSKQLVLPLIVMYWNRWRRFCPMSPHAAGVGCFLGSGASQRLVFDVMVQASRTTRRLESKFSMKSRAASDAHPVATPAPTSKRGGRTSTHSTAPPQTAPTSSGANLRWEPPLSRVTVMSRSPSPERAEWDTTQGGTEPTRTAHALSRKEDLANAASEAVPKPAKLPLASTGASVKGMGKTLATVNRCVRWCALRSRSERHFPTCRFCDIALECCVQSAARFTWMSESLQDLHGAIPRSLHTCLR